MTKRKIVRQAVVGNTGRRGAFFNPNVKPVKFMSIAGLQTPVKRNQLCPCGSGKKYKHCCRLRKQVETPPVEPVSGEEVKNEA